MGTFPTTVGVTNQVLVKMPLSLVTRSPVCPWWLSTPLHHLVSRTGKDSVLVVTQKDSVLFEDCPRRSLVLGREGTSHRQ